MDLSILIPARNEMFLAKTVENLLENIEAETEIIVVLDGEWADPPLQQHERVTVVTLSESIGQRAATNLACRLSTADYVMKLDAHCAVDKGFDRKLIEDMQEDWTVLPTMYNLHAFDWVCGCGERRYQGPPGPCEKCGGETERDIIWQPRWNKMSVSYRFDRNLRFKYWGAYKKRQTGQHVETMSLLGACFMLSRKKYWELDICGEDHGSWGQQGTEVACKTWLSGGKLIVNKNTWFAHMFRTNSKGFSFPYPITGRQVSAARKVSKKLWIDGNWDKAKYPLSWLIDKFSPVPDWENKKGVIYYTDNKLKMKIAQRCRKHINASGLPIVSSSLKKLNFGENILIKGKRGYLTMFRQMLACLERSKAEVVFFCEHDVLYHASHFEFLPPEKDVFYYNVNVWRTNGDACVKVNDCRQVSGLCCYRELALEHYRKRVKRVEEYQGDNLNKFIRNIGFEPGTHSRKERIDDHKSEIWTSAGPNIDIKHGGNLTPGRFKKEQYRNQRFTEGWVEAKHVPEWTKEETKFMECIK